MYCSDTKTLTELKIPPVEYPCVPETVYSANDGQPIGLSTVGYRANKFSPKEAADLRDQRYEQSDQNLNLSQRIRGDSNDLITETSAVTNKNMDNVTQRLKERLKDTNFWKVELEREIADVLCVTDKLVQRKRELENALIALDEVIHVCTDGLNARRRHYGEDLQQDDVERELIKVSRYLPPSFHRFRLNAKQNGT